MKILTASQIRAVDLYTIQNEPVSSIDLMERAAKACVEWITDHFSFQKKIAVFCGQGNNGGDGLAIARILSDNGYSVSVFILQLKPKGSPEFEENYLRLKQDKRVEVKEVSEKNQFPELNTGTLIIDAIFGTGLSKPVEGLVSDIIFFLNSQGQPVVSVDIPSGLLADEPSNYKGQIIKADFTLTFQFPKLAFLFPENNEYTGTWFVLPIGLLEEGMNKESSKDEFCMDEDIKPLLKKRRKFSHKGTFGHSFLIAGSYKKMGAAVLASRACLRSGSGLLTTHIPRKGYEIIQNSVPEAMVSVDEHEEFFTTSFKDEAQFTSIGIGPGIGTSTETSNALKFLIQNSNKPLLLDADALNILSQNPTWISFLLPNSILTPHPKEFERLFGKTGNSFERKSLQVNMSVKYQIYIVLKGAYTSVSTPSGYCYFNSTGNPGMATGGSGDVLTGTILGILAQGYKPLEASLLGVFLHGRAGDIAADEIGENSLIATDIVDNLGKAFLSLEKDQL